MKALLDAVLVDVGGTLVEQAPAGTAVTDLEVQLRVNVVEDLSWLAETVRLAAVTNTAVMDEAQVRQLLEPSGVSALLEVVVTSVDVGVEKPDPTPVLVALERLGLTDPARVLLIGDQSDDEEAAAAAGVHYAPINGLTGEGDHTLRQVVQAWLERTAGHRFEDARSRIRKSDIDAALTGTTLQSQLTKPAGSLGRLEALGIQLCAIAGECPPPVPEPATVAVFAADHGIVDWGVSPWPQEVTAKMVDVFAQGGAAINVLARHAGADLLVVDVGVATPIAAFADDTADDTADDDADRDDALASAGRRDPDATAGTLVRRTVRAGTANLAAGPAMSRVDALLALDVGVEIAEQAVADGARILVTGEMGIGNTTAAAAIIAGITNTAPEDAVGRGSGADDEMLARKLAVIEAATAELSSTSGPLTLLEQVGGFEIAAMAGFIVGAAAAGVPVVVDGVVADAALLIATQLAPDAIDFVIAGHRSTEPAATAALEFLGISPVLDLELRLGEGTGAVLALPLIQAAAKVLREMATFETAGLADEKV